MEHTLRTKALLCLLLLTAACADAESNHPECAQPKSISAQTGFSLSVSLDYQSGTLDACFRWDGTIAEAVAHLKDAGIEIIEGPVPRWAADGVWGQSVYFRDPDGNLLEFLSTAEPMEPLFTE